MAMSPFLGHFSAQTLLGPFRPPAGGGKIGHRAFCGIFYKKKKILSRWQRRLARSKIDLKQWRGPVLTKPVSNRILRCDIRRRQKNFSAKISIFFFLKIDPEWPSLKTSLAGDMLGPPGIALFFFATFSQSPFT